MHEDRLVQATRNLRLTETEQTYGKTGAAYRARMAKALMALATRIAPTVTRAETGTLAPA
jgi:hypothetical protein